MSQKIKKKKGRLGLGRVVEANIPNNPSNKHLLSATKYQQHIIDGLRVQ